jgi:polyferredoxin
VHLGAILFVAAESLLGIACPLTVWEDALRGGQQRTGFIERGVHRVMFYQAPTWVFTTAYIAFAALVLVTWIAVPPIRHRPRSA